MQKIRISAHNLSNEGDLCFKPRIPHEQRIYVQCNQAEVEKHFILFCSKYTDLRITLFDRLHLKISVLKLNTYECFKLFYDLMNHRSAVNTNLFVNLFRRHWNLGRSSIVFVFLMCILLNVYIIYFMWMENTVCTCRFFQ